MASFVKMLDTLVRSCTPDLKKAGKTLLVINAMGMVFAALSNTYAAAVDKNTSAEDKKFLVPAGFATGAANIGLYYAMTTKIIDALQGVEKYKDGKLILKKDGFAQTVLNYMKKNENPEGKTFYDAAIEKFSTKEIKKAGENIKKSAKELFENKEAKEKLFESTFKSGFGVLGAFIGAVVGCAILTPIIRDISAYFVQKKMEKKNPELKDKPYKPYFEPTRIESVRYGNKKQPLSMKSYMAFTSGKNLTI